MQVLILTILLSLAAVPPLTREQAEQLDTATDNDIQVDQAALYPLMQNALDWTPGDESGAAVPDYKAILETPTEARGKLFLIEGRFFRSRQLKSLSREGAWSGENGQEWSVMLENGKRTIVVLYLVNGPKERDLPRVNQNIRVPARFYKVWMDKDADGNLTRYMVFVGNSGRALGRPDAAPLNLPNPLLAIGFVVGVAFLVLTMYRFLSGRESARKRQRELEVLEKKLQEPEEEAVSDDPNLPPLPKDPIKAMEELERRRKAEAESETKGE